MTSKLGYAARMWYYFRVGYSTYLTFLLGYMSTLVTVYYLAIRNIPTLLDIFPRFVPFAVLATIIGGPLSIAIGYMHLKRSVIYSSEVEIGYEANPFIYKLAPGINKEVLGPLWMEMLVQVTRLLEAQGLLKDEDRSRIEPIERKIKILLEGGYVGTPRTTALRTSRTDA
jgi:hypothetical protein